MPMNCKNHLLYLSLLLLIMGSRPLMGSTMRHSMQDFLMQAANGMNTDTDHLENLRRKHGDRIADRAEDIYFKTVEKGLSGLVDTMVIQEQEKVVTRREIAKVIADAPRLERQHQADLAEGTKRQRQALLLGTGGIMLTLLTYFAARHYYQPRPIIIERTDTSMLNWLEKLRGFKVPTSNLQDVILEPELAKRVLGKFEGLTLALQKHMPLSNMLFYGPAGTGKTMAAQAFARTLYEKKLANHVIVRGPALKRLGSASKAQTALADTLRWASKSKLPVIFVFDEAETMFADRGSEYANEMTNDLTTTMLSFFERAINTNMMFVLSTNYPGRIDKALLNRIDPSNRVRFGVPKEQELRALLDLYLRQHIVENKFTIHTEIINEKYALAQKLEGLVGRQVDSLVAQTIYAMLAQGKTELDLQTLENSILQASQPEDLSAY